MSTEKDVEDVNIGTTENPEMVKLSKVLPPQVKAKYISLLSSFTDVFAWDYLDLKEYNKKWISNLVPVQKKTGEIRLCIDFRNLNKVFLKDNYPLPKMDHILQRVVGASRMSLLEGYSRYNQILVHEDDRDKTTFTTLWGTFHYTKMSFSLKNVGATFQQAMDIAFANEKDVFLVVYLDDLTIFSNSDEEHLYHLKIVFQRCEKYGISLNPKKSLFAMDEEKLLGHIISKVGIPIDPARVEAI
eukprot:PITA_07980